MFSWRNKKDISIFRMKNVPYLLLCSLQVSTNTDHTDHNQTADMHRLIRVKNGCFRHVVILYPGGSFVNPKIQTRQLHTDWSVFSNAQQNIQYSRTICQSQNMRKCYLYLLTCASSEDRQDKVLFFQPKSFHIFFYFSMKTYVVGTH